MPWVRLHGTKDYLDMVQILEKHPAIHQTFNLVPSLLEQIEDYANNAVKDKFLELSYKPAIDLTPEDKNFILNNFFSINKEKVIALTPRYYELFFKKEHNRQMSDQDFLDLQVWFNLAWIDPIFKQRIPELKGLIDKARFFTEEEKRIVLDKHIEILKEIIPTYKRFMERGQVELTVSPYFHPILPLLFDTRVAKEANPETVLPKVNFAYPEDVRSQINSAMDFFKSRFGVMPQGMWPSEESVSEQILPFIMESGINWIVTDEDILFRSVEAKKRDTKLLYLPHTLTRDGKKLNIVFRDKNISDLIGFIYNNWDAKKAVEDFIKNIQNIADTFKDKDVLVTIAMDGENAWEYYKNDGIDFLDLLYQKLSETDFIKTTTVSEYLKNHTIGSEIEELAAGSWIYGEFGKWIGNHYKVTAWEYLTHARKLLEQNKDSLSREQSELAWKQMYICEGSDWFWWYGDESNGYFDKLFRMHLSNFYKIIGKNPPEYLSKPLGSSMD